MNKGSRKISIVVCSIILGILISLQFKSIYIRNNGMTTLEKGEQLNLELQRLKTDEANLKAEINTIKDDIERYENNTADDVIKEKINEMRTIAGYTDVEGEGIEIKFIKEANSNNLTYNYDLLLSVVNKLNSAQAVAIDINGNRIVSQSYFNIIEDKLYVNNSKLVEPIVIRAIGDADILASSIEIKYGIVWEIEKYYNYEVEVNKMDNIKIEGHNHDKHIDDLGSGEN